jgi:acylphosphatase
MTNEIHVRISGRVQGVWFRQSTRERAEELGLCGWVRNLPDGRVEAFLSGEESAINAALAFLREGPSMARVDEVQIESRSMPAQPSVRGPFEVR